ncbi:MAG: hypothetical protein D4R56_00960 [Deltaproteobacteria bacterium]|nr:MAG: hypothetical protein D4R56_00960 [Deltaproteobacteria bacterium]
MDFADIGKLLTDGKNLGGLANRIYFGLWNDVAAWPTDPSAPATIELAGTQTGDLVMKAGKRMFELYTTEDAAKLDINVIGEEGGKGYEFLLHVFAPGLHKKLLGFINTTKNEDLVLIAQDSAGQQYLLGCEIRSAKFQGSDGSGTGSTTDGRRGLGMTFAYRTHSLYTYTGTIPLTEAVPEP